MKLFEPELNLAFEDVSLDEPSDGSIEQLESFDFDAHLRGLNTALEDLEKLHNLQQTLAVHPISPASEKLGYISLENFHNYYNLSSQGVSLESLHVATEEEKGGFFKAIGAVIAAIWKAIKTLFKNIWNFFRRLFGFKTDGKKKAKKIEEKQKQIEEELKEQAKRNKNKKNKKSEKNVPTPAGVSTGIHETPDSENVPVNFSPIQEEVQQQDTAEDILTILERDLLHKSIFSATDNPLAYLILSTKGDIEHTHIEKAIELGLNQFPIYGSVMERIHKGVNEFFDRKDFYNNLKRFFDNHDYVGSSNLINDFNEDFYKNIFTPIPYTDEDRIFYHAYRAADLEQKYGTVPELKDVGDIQSPHKGTHHMPFKVNYRNKELGLTYSMFDMVRAEHENIMVDPHAIRNTMYVPFNEIQRLNKINTKLSDINEEQKSENERKFHDIEKRVDKLIENMENILTKPTEIIEQKLRDLEFRNQQSLKTGHSSMFPGRDNMGNDVHQLQVELEQYKRNKRFNTAAMSLIRNNLQTLAVIFRNYSDYLVSVQLFLTHINSMFEISQDLLKVKFDEVKTQ